MHINQAFTFHRKHVDDYHSLWMKRNTSTNNKAMCIGFKIHNNKRHSNFILSKKYYQKLAFIISHDFSFVHCDFKSCNRRLLSAHHFHLYFYQSKVKSMKNESSVTTIVKGKRSTPFLIALWIATWLRIKLCTYAPASYSSVSETFIVTRTLIWEIFVQCCKFSLKVKDHSKLIK